MLQLLASRQKCRGIRLMPMHDKYSFCHSSLPVAPAHKAEQRLRGVGPVHDELYFIGKCAVKRSRRPRSHGSRTRRLKSAAAWGRKRKAEEHQPCSSPVQMHPNSGLRVRIISVKEIIPNIISMTFNGVRTIIAILASPPAIIRPIDFPLPPAIRPIG